VVNKVILIGRLGRDPEMRYTTSGTPVCNFSLATDEGFRDKTGEMQRRTEWHNIVVWAKLAEFCSQYLSKGRQTYVRGELRSRNWEDREGKKRTTVEIVAFEVVPLGPKAGEAGEHPARAAAPARAASAPDDFSEPASQEITDDDIPF